MSSLAVNSLAVTASLPSLWSVKKCTTASGVGAGVGPCVFGCGLVLLPSLALFVGLHLDLGLCCAWSGKPRLN